MTRSLQSPVSLARKDRFLLAWAVCFWFWLLGPLSGVHGAQPPAGSEIVNQGAVHYKDEAGVSQVTQTNIVVLKVRQVYSATIDGDRSRFGAAGQEAVFFHTLVNTGNGTDVFCVTVADGGSDSGRLVRIQAVYDVNGSGSFDSGEPVLGSASGSSFGTLLLAADETARLLVFARVPQTAGAGDAFTVDLTVQAQEGSGTCQLQQVSDIGANADGLDDTNQDTVTVTNDAVLDVFKNAQYNPNGPGNDDDTLDYTVSVRNIGVIAARDVILTDALPLNTAFEAGSIVVSGDYLGGLGDDGANGTDGRLPAHDGGTPGTISAEVDILGPDEVVTLAYRVALDDGLAAGVEIRNTAQAQGDLDGDVLTTEPAVVSNQTVDPVPPFYDVVITDTGLGAGAGVNDGGDDDGTANDVQSVDTVPQGAVVLFENRVFNNGNAVDAFNLEVSGSGFAGGTRFGFFSAGGTVPLLDTNADGVVDTGPLDPGSSAFIVVKAFLPAAAFGSGPYAATVTARSTGDLLQSDDVIETLGNVIGFAVDLANSSAASGFNDGGVTDAHPVAVAAQTRSVDPGGTAIFDLFAANEGQDRDSYQFSAWGDAAASQPLPPGWRVVFKDAGGPAVTASPGVAAGDVYIYQAVVQVPADSLPGTTSVYFRAGSVNSSAADVKQDAVTVNAVELITLSPNQEGSVTPGTFVEYTHVVTNTGNTSEDVAVTVASQSLMNSTLFWPRAFTAEGPALFVNLQDLSPGEDVAVYDPALGQWFIGALVSDGAGGVAVPLAPGHSTQVRVRVFAAPSLPENARDVLVLQARVKDGAAEDTDTDQTVVAAGQLQIVKRGALDADCDGTPDTAFASTRFQARPGECVVWQLTVNNQGAEPVCRVTVFDGATAFTVLSGAPAIFTEPPPGTGACTVSPPEISCTVGNPRDVDGDGTPEPYCLEAGESAEIRFKVQIQ